MMVGEQDRREKGATQELLYCGAQEEGVSLQGAGGTQAEGQKACQPGGL